MNNAWRLFTGGVKHLNVLMGYLSAGLIVVCALVLVYEVLTRYFIKISNDWVIELSVFLLIASTFLAAGFTQMSRAHVGIEVLDDILSPRANRWRFLIADTLSALVCGFIAWKSWVYFHDAWEGGFTTSSTWAPKLWIPYFFMAFGMSMLVVQQVLQVVEDCLAPMIEKAHPDLGE